MTIKIPLATETRCPHCLHVLTDDEAVCFPHEFSCPYCDHRDKPIYEETIPFEFFDNLTVEQFTQISADMAYYDYVMDELREMCERYNISDLRYTPTLSYLSKSIRLYNKWKAKTQHVP